MACAQEAFFHLPQQLHCMYHVLCCVPFYSTTQHRCLSMPIRRTSRITLTIHSDQINFRGDPCTVFACNPYIKLLYQQIVLARFNIVHYSSLLQYLSSIYYGSYSSRKFHTSLLPFSINMTCEPTHSTSMVLRSPNISIVVLKGKHLLHFVFSYV